MSSLDKGIIYYLSRIKRRMGIENIIKFILLAVSYTCGAGILLSIISFFIPIYGVYSKTAFLTVFSVILGTALAIIRRPMLSYAAMKADSLGLHERAITALELSGNESAMALLQKQDAIKYLEGLQYKKKIPLLPDKKYFIICFLLIVALISTGFVKNPMNQRALKLQELRTLKKEQLQDIDKLIEKIKESNKLTMEQKKELETMLVQIKQEAKAAKDMDELQKSLERNQKKMELLSNKYEENKKDFDRVLDTLLKNKSTKAIGELMKNKDSKAVKNAVKDLTNTLNNLNGEEKHKLSESLSKLAEEIKSNKELKEALKKASDKLSENKNLSDEDLKELGDAISELTENENMRSAMEEIGKELNSLKDDKDGSKSEQSGGEDGKEGTEDKGESGQKGDSKQGGEGAQQNGSNGQQNGSGAGNGTDPGSEEQTPNQSGGELSSKESSEKKTGTYEKIFTSKTLGGTGKRSDLKGQKREQGSSEITKGESTQANRGNSVPYNQVFGEYKNEAFESINSSNIPDGMKEIVKDYFSSLE